MLSTVTRHKLSKHLRIARVKVKDKYPIDSRCFRSLFFLKILVLGGVFPKLSYSSKSFELKLQKEAARFQKAPR